MSNKLKNQSTLAAIIATCTALSIAIPADLPKWNGTGLDAYKAVREQLAPQAKVKA